MRSEKSSLVVGFEGVDAVPRETEDRDEKAQHWLVLGGFPLAVPPIVAVYHPPYIIAVHSHMEIDFLILDIWIVPKRIGDAVRLSVGPVRGSGISAAVLR